MKSNRCFYIFPPHMVIFESDASTSRNTPTPLFSELHKPMMMFVKLYNNFFINCYEVLINLSCFNSRGDMRGGCNLLSSGAEFGIPFDSVINKPTNQTNYLVSTHTVNVQFIPFKIDAVFPLYVI